MEQPVYYILGFLGEFKEDFVNTTCGLSIYLHLTLFLHYLTRFKKCDVFRIGIGSRKNKCTFPKTKHEQDMAVFAIHYKCK